MVYRDDTHVMIVSNRDVRALVIQLFYERECPQSVADLFLSLTLLCSCFFGYNFLVIFVMFFKGF